MYKFNNNNIFTGYIKQKLKSFNLPMCRVLTNDQYTDISGLTYIKDDMIVHNTKDNAVIEPFIYNKAVPNFTKNLQITNTIYDTYTHEYLGDYLRFLRDYSHLDLMSMYNCFSNNICTNLSLTGSTTKNVKYIFDSKDTNYKIYMLPVKCGAQYTIAIDTNEPIELFCGLYKKNLYGKDSTIGNKTILEQLVDVTYQKINNISFRNPIIYTKLTDINKNINKDLLTKVLPFEKDLKLFIKLPFNNNSSIVILEGCYLHTNDEYLEPNSEAIIKHEGSPYYCFINAQGKVQGLAGQKISEYKSTLGDVEETEIPYLLQWPAEDTKKGENFNIQLESNHPGIIIQIDDPKNQLYDDSQTGYVDLQAEEVMVPRKASIYTKKPIYENNKAVINFDAPIVEPAEDEEYSNTDPDAGIKTFKPITKLQLLQQNTQESYPFADKLIEYLVGDVVDNIDEISDNITRVQTAFKKNGVVNVGLPGLWDDRIRCIMYAYLMDNNLPKHLQNQQAAQTLYDILGYADKDAEKHYAYFEVVDNKKQTKTLSSIDIYGEEW